MNGCVGAAVRPAAVHVWRDLLADTGLRGACVRCSLPHRPMQSMQTAQQPNVRVRSPRPDGPFVVFPFSFSEEILTRSAGGMCRAHMALLRRVRSAAFLRIPQVHTGKFRGRSHVQSDSREGRCRFATPASVAPVHVRGNARALAERQVLFISSSNCCITSFLSVFAAVHDRRPDLRRHVRPVFAMWPPRVSEQVS
jgi:hypothetical protein